jgi:hypothetical protein
MIYWTRSLDSDPTNLSVPVPMDARFKYETVYMTLSSGSKRQSIRDNTLLNSASLSMVVKGRRGP